MQTELGARVRSRDNQEVGSIKHLILDPKDGQVKTVVLEKGFLLHHDIEVPLSAFQEAEPGPETEPGVTSLNLTANQLQQMPRFDVSLYTEPPPEVLTRFYRLPPGGILWPGGYTGMNYAPGMFPIAVPAPLAEPPLPADDERRDIRQREDRENAVIEAGDDVFSKSGDKIGTVHNVIFDTATGLPTTLVVSKGILFTEHLVLPAAAIDSIDDGVVTLKLDTEQARRAVREPGVATF